MFLETVLKDCLRDCLKRPEVCRLLRKGLAARHNPNGPAAAGHSGTLFGLERRAVVVSVQTLRAELLLAVASVGHEAQGLQARVPRTRLAQQPKSISATCLRALKTVSQTS